ncbi:hypothetical protein sos41_04810 [Alphaproteobacteria bacterium SO-S41]|nr:hypothetical protein sos41_04810 [Alphaproteobacteria bacterium SO-S41]
MKRASPARNTESAMSTETLLLIILIVLLIGGGGWGYSRWR